MKTNQNFSSIPSELKRLPNWVCWSKDKLPKNAKTGGNAQSNNPSTWSGFETAVQALDKYGFDGIGLMFSSGYFGVDLDHVLPDEKALADEFAAALQSYAEISRSGTGIHIICKGTLPQGGRRRKNVEMYSEGRYFIMTGNPYGDCTTLRDCTEAIQPLHSKYLSSAAQPPPKAPSPPFISTGNAHLDDDAILKKAFASKNGALFERLTRGDWEGTYTSHSEADFAFSIMLAFWTQKDPDQMDRMFRSSGLMRTKWERKQRGTTYGALVIQSAIDRCGPTYAPTRHDARGSPSPPIVEANHESPFESPQSIDATTPPETIPQSFTTDDTGNAERYYQLNKGQIRYSYVHKHWYVWDGMHWADDNTGQIKMLADQMLKTLREEYEAIPKEERPRNYARHLAYIGSNKGKTSMLRECEHKPGIPLLPDEMDSQKELLNTPSGIVDLKTGTLSPHDSALLMTRLTGAPYLENAKPPTRWLAFLDDITGGDKALQEYLCRAVGYSMTGSNREQCLFVCYGGGQNGKSTFLDIIGELCGSYSANMQAETLMVKNGSGANSDIARLKGVRFATSAEPSEGMRFNEGLLKQLTGGDKVTARFLYGSEFEFEPQFKIWLATNVKPFIRGTDNGIWRRMKLIPFDVQIPDSKVDKSLIYKLRKELPQIMSWAVQGAVEWSKSGLCDPKRVTDANKEYRFEMDTLSSFLDACTLRAVGETIGASTLYAIYAKWADENGEYKMSGTKFGREMTKRFEKSKAFSGSIYSDITLNAYGIQCRPHSNYNGTSFSPSASNKSVLTPPS